MHIRDRIKELRRVPAGALRPNPRNWRTHPDAQRDALRGVLAEIGYADALLARELDDGALELVDGHLRAETTPDATVPVLVLDVSAEEADKLLLTLDPLAGLAGVDEERLTELLTEVKFASPQLEQLLDGLAREAAGGEIEVDDTDDERDEVEVPESWQVVVECTSEADQESVYSRLKNEGYKCRVLTL
jgi:ParB-like chromosome segregation protein Spo0J